MDFMDICTVANPTGNLNSPDPRDWWDGSEINIWEDWDKCTEAQIRRWQFSVNKFFGEGDRIASNWLQTFVYNSSTDSLKTAVAKKYEKLPSNQKAGVIYLYMSLCEMFQMSREVKEAMYKFLDIFRRNGVARYTGENVLVVSEEVLGVCKRLDAVGALLEEHVIDVLSGLSICTNSRFRDMFKHLKQSAELENLHVLGTISLDSTPMEQIEPIFDKAIDQYDKLCLAQVWNRTTKGGPSAHHLNSIVDAVDKCWNCNQEGHQARQCPKPRNKATFEKNLRAYKDSVRSRGGGGQGGSGSGGGGGDKKDGPAKGTPEYHRKQWEHNACQMVDGKLYIDCKVCGLNTTHSSRDHKIWVRKGSAYKIMPDHFYAKERARLGQDRVIWATFPMQGW
jgi:hypothetical protein